MSSNRIKIYNKQNIYATRKCVDTDGINALSNYFLIQAVVNPNAQLRLDRRLREWRGHLDCGDRILVGQREARTFFDRNVFGLSVRTDDKRDEHYPIPSFAPYSDSSTYFERCPRCTQSVS